MNKIIMSAFLYCTVNPGIHVMGDLPADLSVTLIQPTQTATTNALKSYCQEAELEGPYKFGPSPFNPHLSLAFIEQNDLPADEIEKKYPGLCTELTKIAELHPPVTLNECLSNLTIEAWDGKFKVMHEEKQKEHYLNIVLKLGDCPQLNELSAAIVKMLNSKYNIAQRFPFSAHLTLGRIYTDEDKPINPEIKEFVKKFVGESLRNISHNTTDTNVASSSSSLPSDLLINQFNLSCPAPIYFTMNSIQ